MARALDPLGVVERPQRHAAKRRQRREHRQLGIDRGSRRDREQIGRAQRLSGERQPRHAHDVLDLPCQARSLARRGR
jgi:hypothetical protein